MSTLFCVEDLKNKMNKFGLRKVPLVTPLLIRFAGDFFAFCAFYKIRKRGKLDFHIYSIPYSTQNEWLDKYGFFNHDWRCVEQELGKATHFIVIESLMVKGNLDEKT